MALSMKGKVYVIKKQNSTIEKLWAMGLHLDLLCRVNVVMITFFLLNAEKSMQSVFK
jgi:hypothetical protein